MIFILPDDNQLCQNNGDAKLNIPLHILCEIAKYVESARDNSRMAPQMYNNITRLY